MMLLGIGGIKALEELKIKPTKYHLNESHAAFGVLELLKKYGKNTKQKLVFTTHTPAEHGHKKMSLDSLKYYLGDYFRYINKDLFIDNVLNLTTFCLDNAGYSNAVAQRHSEISGKMFSSYKIDYVTNGINSNYWVSNENKKIFNTYIKDWQNRPDALRNSHLIPDRDLIKSHSISKQNLIDYVKKHTHHELRKDVFTIGFARRVDGYKRSNLIFKDIDRLRYIAKRHGGLQLIFSGKAYFNYGPAEEVIKNIYALSKEDFKYLKVVYLEDYSIEISKLMTAGVDCWLNNPIKPLEASGTSGMKAALNGVPNFSTIDGWWVEGCIEGVTGWSIGEDYNVNSQTDEQYELDNMYHKLDSEILKIYQTNLSKWLKIKKNAIALNANYFNTHRMMSEYINKAYF